MASFGKVVADLIAEGQSDPALQRDLFEDHIRVRQVADIAEIERAQKTGEFAAAVDPAQLIEMLFGSLFHRRLLSLPLTEQYGDAHHRCGFLSSGPSVPILGFPRWRLRLSMISVACDGERIFCWRMMSRWNSGRCIRS
ncbi:MULTISPECIES: TetR-like C-terminal domain-containing protein [Rhizobium/Agrobacterium group]|uniref:Tetracyclin repressor-like C-terminal domain-containing protein n=1 Tax=Agrobacterium vitis TaxID=373 RepID=A0ABD6HFP7_AGRVI|nr:hypothetical protein [Agrobacterium vitis]MUO44127.1 hypothetical protein [Agrobacterium vitis]MUP13141.1 hypothetical protein [Agrobacterium vitis]